MKAFYCLTFALMLVCMLSGCGDKKTVISTEKAHENRDFEKIQAIIDDLKTEIRTEKTPENRDFEKAQKIIDELQTVSTEYYEKLSSKDISYDRELEGEEVVLSKIYNKPPTPLANGMTVQCVCANTKYSILSGYRSGRYFKWDNNKLNKTHTLSLRDSNKDIEILGKATCNYHTGK